VTRFTSWAATDPGAVRKHNEDNMLSRPELGLWAVADGAGGHESGEVAAARIVAALAALPAALAARELPGAVAAAVVEAHEDLRALAASREGGGMIASTFVGLLLDETGYICLWAGDSRAYRFRGGALLPISRDHSLVQELVDRGALAAAEAEHHPHANIITRAVGAPGAALELAEVTGDCRPGDRFLLCSDGLTKALSEPEIAALLAAPDEPAPAARLIEAALARRARDNVTAIIIDASV